MYTVAVKVASALCPGDRIRLIAPASPFDRERFAQGVEVVRRLGFEPVFDRAELRRTGFLAGEDADRGSRLEQALLSPDVKAVWCIRGGYGCTRLLPRLNTGLLRQHPKVFIGFSDVTALHLQLCSPGGYVTFHGPVITQLPVVPRSALQWLKRLISEPCPGTAMPFGKLATVVPGRARGFLLGGNLSLLASLVGTPFLPPFAGAILCLEDTGEEAYRLDRMVQQVLQSGILKNVFGVVLGSFAGCKPGGRGRFSARVVMERAVAGLGVPTVSGASFGHIPRNMAWPEGVLASLDASAGTLTLLDAAVG